jgi:hypothetical protein
MMFLKMSLAPVNVKGEKRVAVSAASMQLSTLRKLRLKLGYLS